MARRHAALGSLTLAILATSTAASFAQQASSVAGGAVNPAILSVISDVRLDEQRDEEMGTVEKDSVESVLQTLDGIFRTPMLDQKSQWPSAACALVAGVILLVVDCRIVFKWVGVGFVVLAAVVVAVNELRARWPIGYEKGLVYVIGMEAGVCAGYAALRGYQGLMVLVGVLLGAGIARWIQLVCDGLGHNYFPTDGVPTLVLYSALVVGCVVMIRQKVHTYLLSYVTPFLGGAIVSSLVFWLVACLTAETAQPWADFFWMLCNPESKDVGSTYRVWGIVLWGVIFILGALRQNTIIVRDKIAKRASN